MYYSDDLQTSEPLHIEPASDKHIFEFGRVIDEYNLSVTHHYGGNEHEEHLFLLLTHCREQELEHHLQSVNMHECAKLSPTLNDILKRHAIMNPNLTVNFHGICFDESAQKSVTGINQWVAYLQRYHLPFKFHVIYLFETTITFGGKSKQKVEVSTVEGVNIRIPVPGLIYFDYESLLIKNNVPMLLWLALQIRLRNITDKKSINPTANLRSHDTKIRLVFEYNQFYYEPDNTAKFRLSFTELAQIRRNVGHAPLESIYTTLRRAYPVETGANDLQQKLQKITKSYKVCKLHSKKPNRYHAILSGHGVFNFDDAINVIFIRVQPILYAVYRQTYFSCAASLAKQDSYTENFMAIL